MGRRYYCDYCDKRLPTGLNHRKNHNKGIQHINNKTIYYLQFKEPIEIFLDEFSKRMCKQWNQTGSCSFGENCKYSHRFNYQLIQFIEQQNRNSQTNFDVQQWIRRKLTNQIILPESLLS